MVMNNTKIFPKKESDIDDKTNKRTFILENCRSEMDNVFLLNNLDFNALLRI